MPTRITFLGTAGEHAVLYKYNKCAGGIIIEANNQFFLVDPGPGALVQAGNCKFNFRENNAIFLSSVRVEQMSDANGIIDAMTAKGLDKRGVLVAPQKALTDSSLLKSYQEWMEKTITAEPGKMIGIEDVTIGVHPVYETDGVGFSFFTEEGIITYTGNTSYTEDLAKMYERTGILIINVFNPKGVTTPGFLSTQDAIRIGQTVRPKLIIITHFGMKMMAAEPLYEAREIQRVTGIQTIAAKEGMTLAMTPYASSVIVK